MSNVTPLVRPGRHFEDWLSAYVAYVSFTEAPVIMHFWAAVSALAGALRRHVWIEQYYFKWYPNHYVILVGPPGSTKSTAMHNSMRLLKQVPGIHFGPKAITGPKLLDEFAAHTEEFRCNGETHRMAALNIEASELGNLIDPKDRDLLDWLVDHWDSATGTISKGTRSGGIVTFENPYLNIIAGTTPKWIEGYMPESMIGGGFTSRCLFIFTEGKSKLVPYVDEVIPKDINETEALLVADLKHIAKNLIGPYAITPTARDWGRAWYKELHVQKPSEDYVSTFISRKWVHLHKLAMICAASRRDNLVIQVEDLQRADLALREIDADLPKVFSKVGSTPEALAARKFIEMIQAHPMGVAWPDAYLAVHKYFPRDRDFADMVEGAVRSGQVRTEKRGRYMWLLPPLTQAKPGA